MNTLLQIIAFLDLVLPYTVGVSILLLFVLPLFGREQRWVGCLMLPMCVIGWIILWSAWKFLENIVTPAFSLRWLYVCVLAGGQVYLIFAVLELIDSIRNPFSDSYSGSDNSMDCKGRIYDSEGNVTGYFDKD
jgi:hypothetical protein